MISVGLPRLDRLFGGLSRLWTLRHRLGLSAFVLLLAHPARPVPGAGGPDVLRHAPARACYRDELQAIAAEQSDFRGHVHYFRDQGPLDRLAQGHARHPSV